MYSQLLRSYGIVHGWVFGAYAEASPDVHALLAHTVALEARRSWEEMGARGYQEAMARLTASVYADWGMAAARPKVTRTRTSLRAYSALMWWWGWMWGCRY